MNWLVYIFFAVHYSCMVESHPKHDVYVFHLIDNALWGNVDGSAIEGNFECQSSIPIPLRKCVFISSTFPDAGSRHNSKTRDLLDILQRKLRNYSKQISNNVSITVSLYNIHTWGTISKWPHAPDQKQLPSQFTIAESEESTSRFHKLFSASFPHFDASSTTSPFSTIQRTYFSGLNASEFLEPIPFHQLIKGAAFVASECHRGSQGIYCCNVAYTLKQLHTYLHLLILDLFPPPYVL
jgi:hypothetical protein